MVRFRLAWLVTLALALSSTQPGWSDDQKTLKPAFAGPGTVLPLKSQAADKQDLTCSVYALGELAYDPNFGKWIGADTIPAVIQPGSWSRSAGSTARTTEPGRRLSYYAPAKILVVYHTPAVQAKVAACLQDLKKAIPTQRDQATARSGKSKATDPQVVPAKYATPSLIKTADPATPAKSTYPVPAPAVQPRHLFHLIIRYEGDGITDANVAGLVKGIYANIYPNATAKEETEDKAKSEPAASAAQLSQMFQFIVRYEGDGIIDSNVAELLKTLYSQKAAGDAVKTEQAVPGATAPVPPASDRVPAPKDQPGVPSGKPARGTPRDAAPAAAYPTTPVRQPPVRSGQLPRSLQPVGY